MCVSFIGVRCHTRSSFDRTEMNFPKVSQQSIAIHDPPMPPLPTPSRTCLYEGRVIHVRTKSKSSPVENAFAYPVWMALVDLEEVEANTLPSSIWVGFKHDTFALAKWRRDDHFGDTNEKLSVCVRRLIKEHAAKTGNQEAVARDGPIRLLTNLATFGYYNFNPVSVFYCYDQDGTTLRAVVLEVSNTPWLDTREYVVFPRSPEFTAAWEKDFHVSPFMDALHDYVWRFMPPGDNLVVDAISKRRDDSKTAAWTSAHVNGPAFATLSSIEDMNVAETTFVVGLTLKRVDLARARSVILANPLMPVVAVLWIHIQAFNVWWKGVPYVTPPPGSRDLNLKDAGSHLLLFVAAMFQQYGRAILPTFLLWLWLRHRKPIAKLEA